MSRIAIAASLALMLGACSSADAPRLQTSAPAGPSVITGSGSGSAAPRAVIAGPPGCASPIADYQDIIDRDAETGYLNPGVYNRLTTDLEPVKRACAEGREAEAQKQLASVKARYGYR
ncbi:MAG: hypothetical protein IT539_02575 [Bradyrhizobiaceae bacterium]|nr:hypothetical protein [Bradyrhizobiaceae bacterium]